MRDKITQAYTEHFGQPPTVVASAPGRLELLGNHTDYNEGFVLSCGIDRATWVAAGPASGRECRVCSEEMDQEAVFSVPDVGPAQAGQWANYVKGVVLELQQRGLRVPAFNALVCSDVPLSAGMSSSAALEIATAYALGKLAGAELPPAEWARVGQGSENHYVGARTGLLDQFSAIFSQANHLVFSDFRTLEVRRIPCPANGVFVVSNTGVKHDLRREYGERRDSCEQAAKVLAGLYAGVRTLRDVSLAQLTAARDHLDLLPYRRALHVVGEDERVQQGLAALGRGDLAAFGALMNQSHASSREHFENSCPELDVLVSIGQSLPGGYGSRLSGGGFGGIAIHLVERAEAERFRLRLATAAKTRLGQAPETMICAVGAGAAIHV